jgi:hypothetical protein
MDPAIAADLERRLEVLRSAVELAIETGLVDDVEQARQEAEALTWALRMAGAVVVGEVGS